MLAARQRATCAARQLQRTARTYASDAHHAKPAEANESFGTGTLLTIGALFGGVALYQVAPRGGKEGSSLSQTISGWMSQGEDWEEINSRHTKIMEQAAYDRNLFQNGAGSDIRHVELAFPEQFGSHARRNVRSGSLINLDHVVDHYRQEHLKAEEKKVAKLEEKKE